MTNLALKTSKTLPILMFIDLYICLLLCSSALVSSLDQKDLICCDRTAASTLNDKKAAKECVNTDVQYEYKVNGTDDIERCDICTFKMYPWKNEKKKFDQSCTRKDRVDIAEEFGEVGKCRYHPRAAAEDSYFYCACADKKKCNAMVGALTVPEEEWDPKLGDDTTCGAGEVQTATYPDPSGAVKHHCETKINAKNKGYKLGRCVAKYELHFDKNPGILNAKCASTTNKVDEWSVKFPLRNWKYPQENKATHKSPKSTGPTETPPEKNSGAVKTFATISTQVIVCALTWSIL